MEGVTKEVQELLSTLPKERGWRTTQCLYNYGGLWNQAKQIQAIISLQSHFKACDSDVIWLKALMFAMANPIMHVETQKFFDIPHPRLFGTHTHYPLLPESIKSSKCKIIYLCRNSLDNFNLTELTIEEAFDMYCKGVFYIWAFWDHILGYWKAGLESPDKFLFLRYEDMKAGALPYVKRLAEFMGCPFSDVEDRDGIIEEITKLVDTSQSSYHFRKGEVGGWGSHITLAMADRLTNIMETKLSGTGLSFKSDS
uniref:Sulfotransferase n=1 Tax=Kalanchoe fedtschenkoi TaxID=63787 RepID=A0A7N0ZS74_KALFE